MGTVFIFNFVCKERNRPQLTQLNSKTIITQEGISKFNSDHKLFHGYNRITKFHGTLPFPLPDNPMPTADN